MARRIPRNNREMERELNKRNPDLKSAKERTFEGKTNSIIYRKLKNAKVNPILSMPEVNKIAKSASKRSGVPIHIGYKGASALERKHLTDARGIAWLDEKTGRVWVRLHPMVQYQTKKHLNTLIEHELDHVKVYKSWKTSKGKKIPKYTGE